MPPDEDEQHAEEEQRRGDAQLDPLELDMSLVSLVSFGPHAPHDGADVHTDQRRKEGGAEQDRCPQNVHGHHVEPLGGKDQYQGSGRQRGQVLAHLEGPIQLALVVLVLLDHLDSAWQLGGIWGPPWRILGDRELRLGPAVAIELETNPIVADEEHVLRPVPVGAWVGMAIDPAAGAGTAGYLIVADYVRAVYRNLILLAEPRREPRRGMVHLVGERVRVVYVTCVLDADAVRVGVPPTGVPGDVLVAHTLRHPAFPADDVVRRRLGGAVLKPAYSAGGGALCDVDNDLVYVVGGLPVGGSVVA